MARKKGGKGMEWAYAKKSLYSSNQKDNMGSDSSSHSISEAQAMRGITRMMRRDVTIPLVKMSSCLADSILIEITKQTKNNKDK